jgi:hypothetical protein
MKSISRRTACKWTLAIVASLAVPSATWSWFRRTDNGSFWRLIDLAKADVTPTAPTTSIVPTPIAARSNFHVVYDDLRARDRFFLFLQNVYHLYPESQFHQLIIDTTKEFRTDEEIYLALQERLDSIKPFLSEATYGLPALKKQKAEMARQTAELLGTSKRLSGYVEIGTTGRYAHGIRDLMPIDGPLYIVNDLEPSYSPNDIAERGQLTKLGEFVPMGNYESFDGKPIPPESVELVTNFIGFHHAPPEKRARFVQAVWNVLKPGGRLVVRDHDVNSSEMDAFVGLAHDVFNAGLKITWADNAAQIRNFTSVPQLEEVLGAAGFEKTKTRALQTHDPTQNTLMVFVKPGVRAL